MFGKKKDENLRLCVNYRDLNFITVNNRQSLSLIKQIFDGWSKTAIFTNLNIRFAYNALQIRNNNEWKTAFRCRYEHFEYRVMFSELTNALTNF